MKIQLKCASVAVLLTTLVAGCGSGGPAKMPPAKVSEIEAVVTVSGEGPPVFPELRAPMPPAMERLLERTASNGVCISGGGTRSQAAAVGQLRALHAMGLVERIRYMTAVSSGGLTVAPFFYYRSGPANDEEFLGPMVTPEQRRTWSFDAADGESWATTAANSIGRTVTVRFEVPFAEHLLFGPHHEAWQRAVGKVYFEPFGLYDRNHPRFFSLDDHTVREILKRHETLQPEWSESDFVTVRGDRPYLILTATIIWPTDFKDRIDKVLIEHSPLGVGNPQLITLEEKGFRRTVEQPTGGGFVEPFAFGSYGPTSPPDLPPSGSGLVRMPASEHPFTLWQASGMGSAAYAASPARIDRNFLPDAVYWSPVRAGKTPAQVLKTGDVGNLEDLGIMPLLQRQVKKIVVFANSSVKLDDLVEESKKRGETDTLIAPLFGVNTAARPKNKVFAADRYAPLVRKLQEAQRSGGLPMARERYQVQANSWYGVRPYEVEILWVYNDVSENWIEQLDPEVAAIVREGMADKGRLKDFPNFKTIAENGLHLVALKAQQVTLMADMFSWSMQQPGAREHLEHMLAPPQDQ